ncbi:hypothetical protein PMIN04_012609 [Paraphaeosphaeria minitans]
MLILWVYIHRKREHPKQSNSEDRFADDAPDSIAADLDIEARNHITSSNQDDLRQSALEEIVQAGGKLKWGKKYSIFWPFTWPVGHRFLQFRFIVTVIAVFLQQYAGYLGIFYFGELMNHIQKDRSRSSVWSSFCLYAATQIFSQIFLSNITNFCWMGVVLHRKKKLFTTAHTTIMTHDASFHSSTTPTETIKAVDYADGVDGLFDDILYGFLANALEF